MEPQMYRQFSDWFCSNQDTVVTEVTEETTMWPLEQVVNYFSFFKTIMLSSFHLLHWPVLISTCQLLPEALTLTAFMPCGFCGLRLCHSKAWDPQSLPAASRLQPRPQNSKPGRGWDQTVVRSNPQSWSQDSPLCEGSTQSYMKTTAQDTDDIQFPNESTAAQELFHIYIIHIVCVSS